MEMKEICPCPNLECPNQGDCASCTSRHLKKGSLNYCGLHAILPKLREAIDASPESPSAKKLAELIEGPTKAHEGLMKKHNLSKESRRERLKKMGDFALY